MRRQKQSSRRQWRSAKKNKIKFRVVPTKRKPPGPSSMASHDRPQNVQHEVKFADEIEVQEEMAKHPVPATPAPEVGDTPMPSSSASASLQAPMDPGLTAPVTPQDFPVSVGGSPRHSATTRSHGPEGDEVETKRAKVDEPKKQRINALSLQNMPRWSEQSALVKRRITRWTTMTQSFKTMDASATTRMRWMICGKMRKSYTLQAYQKLFGMMVT